QKQYLDGLKTAVDQGDALIEDLLTYSGLGQTQPEIWNVRIHDLIKEIRSLHSWGNDTEITVQAEWPAFYADRVLLKQILQNLISNGIKFNRRSPKCIEIGCRSTARGEIEIFVRDNGIGIDSKYHDQIFRIFQRLHTNREYPGTGIGLAIVNKAASKLGGSVRMESTVGEGTIFFVCLPLK
ncbi:MAG: ATP-binding protein, partial [Desulfosarcina sp.]